MLLLSTDRAKKGPATIDDGNAEKKSGAALLVVGRGDKDGNPDLVNDSAYFYVSMKSDIDSHLNSTFEGNTGKVSYAVIKSDAVRITGRKDIKIFSEDGKGYVFLKNDNLVFSIGNTKVLINGDQVTIDSKKIALGKNATLGAVLVDKLLDFLNKLIISLNSGAAPPTGGAVTWGSPLPIVPQDLGSKRTFVDAG